MSARPTGSSSLDGGGVALPSQEPLSVFSEAVGDEDVISGFAEWRGGLRLGGGAVWRGKIREIVPFRSGRIVFLSTGGEAGAPMQLWVQDTNTKHHAVRVMVNSGAHSDRITCIASSDNEGDVFVGFQSGTVCLVHIPSVLPSSTYPCVSDGVHLFPTSTVVIHGSVRHICVVQDQRLASYGVWMIVTVLFLLVCSGIMYFLVKEGVEFHDRWVVLGTLLGSCTLAMTLSIVLLNSSSLVMTLHTDGGGPNLVVQPLRLMCRSFHICNQCCTCCHERPFRAIPDASRMAAIPTRSGQAVVISSKSCVEVQKIDTACAGLKLWPPNVGTCWPPITRAELKLSRDAKRQRLHPDSLQGSCTDSRGSVFLPHDKSSTLTQRRVGSFGTDWSASRAIAFEENVLASYGADGNVVALAPSYTSSLFAIVMEKSVRLASLDPRTSIWEIGTSVSNHRMGTLFGAAIFLDGRGLMVVGTKIGSEDEVLLSFYLLDPGKPLLGGSVVPKMIFHSSISGEALWRSKNGVDIFQLRSSPRGRSTIGRESDDLPLALPHPAVPDESDDETNTLFDSPHVQGVVVTSSKNRRIVVRTMGEHIVLKATALHQRLGWEAKKTMEGSRGLGREREGGWGEHHTEGSGAPFSWQCKAEMKLVLHFFSIAFSTGSNIALVCRIWTNFLAHEDDKVQQVLLEAGLSALFVPVVLAVLLVTLWLSVCVGRMQPLLRAITSAPDREEWKWSCGAVCYGVWRTLCFLLFILGAHPASILTMVTNTRIPLDAEVLVLQSTFIPQLLSSLTWTGLAIAVLHNAATPSSSSSFPSTLVHLEPIFSLLGQMVQHFFFSRNIIFSIIGAQVDLAQSSTGQHLFPQQVERVSSSIQANTVPSSEVEADALQKYEEKRNKMRNQDPLWCFVSRFFAVLGGIRFLLMILSMTFLLEIVGVVKNDAGMSLDEVTENLIIAAIVACGVQALVRLITLMVLSSRIGNDPIFLLFLLRSSCSQAMLFLSIIGDVGPFVVILHREEKRRTAQNLMLARAKASIPDTIAGTISFTLVLTSALISDAPPTSFHFATICCLSLLGFNALLLLGGLFHILASIMCTNDVSSGSPQIPEDEDKQLLHGSREHSHYGTITQTHP